ncbi:MAG: glutamate dehydrogenase (NAD(P)+) [Nitrospinales bacterium]|jgi:glutamate dehydrogenase (NAD(P)+)
MDLLPKSLSAELLPKTHNRDRFSKNSVATQEAKYQIIDPETKRVWGYVCIDNTQRGPGLGGIRMAANIGLNEVSRLSRAMTLKNSAACLPYGGGKAGLIANNSRFYNDPKSKSLLIEKFADALFELNNYLPAPDMGTDEYDIQSIYNNHSKKLNKETHDRGGVGRPVECGGVPIDDWGLTAHGLFSAALSLEDILEDFKLNNSKIVIQGFGNVGCPTAIKLEEKGAQIVGASDINGALWNSNGLDIEELAKIRKQSGGLSNYSKSVEKKFDSDKVDWLLEAPCDILIPAARPDAITAKNIDRIDCRLIIQGANNPSSKPVEYYLKHRRNILSLTDFIVNAGGVIGCAVERKMIGDEIYSMRVQEQNTRTYTENLIFDTVTKNMKEIFSRLEEDYIFRDAATDLAMERLETRELWL